MKAPTSADPTRLTHVIARLIALVPQPRVNLTRFHGVFPPTERIVRGYRRPSAKASMVDAKDTPTSVDRRVSMTWVQRLKRVFNIDIETCNCFGEHVKIIACIVDPVGIEKIVTHLARKDAVTIAPYLPLPWAPPKARLIVLYRTYRTCLTNGGDTDGAARLQGRRDRATHGAVAKDCCRPDGRKS